MEIPLSTNFRLEKGEGKHEGFTLIELLIVITIISTIIPLVFGKVADIYFTTREARTNVELSQMANAVYQMAIDNNGVWPGDVNRGVPPGIENYLGTGNWEQPPWPGSEYDWDSFTGSDGKTVYQISVRFCPLGQPSQCQIPDAEWSTNFDYYSSYYYCIQGICRSHPGRPDNHPGHCVNC